MKERARNETVSVNQIYREAIEKINSNPELAEVASVLPILPSLKSSLHRKRRVSSRWGSEKHKEEVLKKNKTEKACENTCRRKVRKGGLYTIRVHRWN